MGLVGMHHGPIDDSSETHAQQSSGTGLKSEGVGQLVGTMMQ